MTTNKCRRRQSLLAFLVAAAAAGVILLFLLQAFSFRNSIIENQSLRRKLTSANLSQFTDPKTVTPRSDATPLETLEGEGINSRNYCQVVYILGVEGATHHGFIPIVEALANHQVDPESYLQYSVTSEPHALKAGLFGWFAARWRKWGFRVAPEIDDPAFVQRVVKESCPDNGQKHVLIEWASFPSGHEDDPRSYRVHRQHEWLSMTPEEIADNNEAQQQPFNLTAFVRAYSPYVDIKFVVIHRPFLETIASHYAWDGGAEIHSNIIRGFILILGRFLDAQRLDLVTGGPLWTLVCVERIMAKHYENLEDVKVARLNFLSHLSSFLGWPVSECPRCFDKWRESKKDPLAVLGPKNAEMLIEHTKLLEGVWPPSEEGVEEQQCGI